MPGLMETEQTQVITAQLAASFLPVPGAADHKYTRGVVRLVTGSKRYPGAGVLSAGGASYGGAGMVSFAGSERSADLVLRSFPEVILGGERADALVIGSGWGPDLVRPARAALEELTGPLVIDAGAMQSREFKEGGDAVARVLTPHSGEARELWGSLTGNEAYPEDQQEAAAALARITGALVVLKGATTCVSDGSRTMVYRARSAWPGVAGAGDVLAGVIGSALARWWRRAPAGTGTPQSATDSGLRGTVAAAVFLHGEAGALAAGADAAHMGAATHPVRASDIINWLPKAWETLPRS